MVAVYLAFAVVILWFGRRWILSLLTPRSIPGIPAYPDPVPVLGDIPRLAASMKATNGFIGFMDKVAKDLGPIAQVRISFLNTMVVVTDYQSIDNILTKQTQHCDRDSHTIKAFRTILPRALISLPTNDMWKHHRRIIGTAMTSKYLSLTTPRANESVKELVNLWRRKASVCEGRAWAAEGDMESAALDAICGMAFGHSWGIIPSYSSQLVEGEYPTGINGEVVFDTVRPELAESTWAIFNSLPTTSSFPYILHKIRTLSPTYRRHARRLDRFLDAKLADSRARAESVGAEVAVDVADNTLDLMTARQLRGDDWMPDDEMKDEVFQYLVAGTETSGCTLAWWLKYMTNHPEVQRKLRKHMLEKLPEMQDRPPKFEDLNATNTPYLEAVVHETLRLSRTAGGYSREVTQDVTVLGKVIPKGCTIIIPTVTGLEDRSTPVYGPDPNALGSDSVDPDDIAERMDASLEVLRPGSAKRKVGFWKPGSGFNFDPERWLNEQGHFDINAGPSLPFSAGQRGCFGKNLAMLELRFFISQLNQTFFFAPVSDALNSFDMYQTVTTHPRQCFIRPVSWDSDL
ncbi:cytochrome P450 [Naematelia encephala]|uniref:Cytochrome P450 n=1 Tax=Naematelia encephala TaxID=71784 RepID=A0A1Y2AGX5_9TREE|nr:cytochrome P450 [Naematelia encephala]